MSKPIEDDSQRNSMVFEKLNVRREGVVKDRVNAIALPPAEDIRRDSDLFLEGTRTNQFQALTQAAMKRGFQTKDAEMDLARLVGDLDEHGTNEAQHSV